MKIGFFDSGIGGLTVLKEAIKVMPNEEYIYFADTENVPYGTKPKEEVARLMEQAADYLAQQSIKALVVACNTATSIAISQLRKRHNFPILGMEPAVKPAIENFGDKRILVTATSLTLKEEKLENLLSKVDTKHVVDKLALDGLVGFAENFIFEGNEVEKYIQERFEHLNFSEYSAIVLGCTHFIYFKDLIMKMCGQSDIHIVDGNLGTVRHLQTTLNERGLRAQNSGLGNVDYVRSCTKENREDRINKMNTFLYEKNS